MTLFEANARVKEISIRKVLGASAANLVALLSLDNIRLVVLSSMISMPLTYFIAREWLATYPMHVGLSPVFFLTPLAVILLMVTVTSLTQTIRAAGTNPTEHLKNE
jgi:ABC-type antimicrobial peptide transport system permease subunit